jgi:hypothetical protein
VKIEKYFSIVAGAVNCWDKWMSRNKGVGSCFEKWASFEIYGIVFFSIDIIDFFC